MCKYLLEFYVWVKLIRYFKLYNCANIWLLGIVNSNYL